jgi:hypothetical protein
MYGVTYLNIGTCCLVRLVTSIWSLRETGYAGRIAVMNAHDDGLLASIATDNRLGIEVIPIDVPTRKRHTSFCVKSRLWRYTPFARTIYLDADTIVWKDPSGMFYDLLHYELVVTQFANWLTTGKIVAGRLAQWQNVKHPRYNLAEEARYLMQTPKPALNTGVFAFALPECKAWLEAWESVTHAGEKCSFTDELSCQLLVSLANHKLLDERWNCCPMRVQCQPSEVFVWHLHGSRHARRDQGRKIWIPEFHRALSANVGWMQDWYPAGDKSLQEYLASCQSVS